MALALSGCYSPRSVAPCTASCDLATQPDCPSGLECRADKLCHLPGSDACAPQDGGTDVGFTANVMFVTSTMKAPKDFNGLMGADTWCNAAAMAGQLPQGTYRAWL